MNNEYLIKKLIEQRRLSEEEYLALLRDESVNETLRAAAMEEKRRVYGNAVYFRGLIEIGNICKNDCYYCGIRASNHTCQRYRLTAEEILECCETGYLLGFRTFVLQGGEDAYYTDERLVFLISAIKSAHPDCAVTLSLGERGRESFRRLKEAGADRYLLRHETIDKEHYRLLHPENLLHEHRLQALQDLRECGFQVGCGFMVGSPSQSLETLARELKFIEEFRPDMCGIGPFIPHKDTPFKAEKAGSVELTLKLLSLIRLIHPTVLLPATTALSTLSEEGRIRGILAGANVVMPNLSPENVRDKYSLYNNKAAFGAESAEHLAKLQKLMESVGHTLVSDRGDRKEQTYGNL